MAIFRFPMEHEARNFANCVQQSPRPKQVARLSRPPEGLAEGVRWISDYRSFQTSRYFQLAGNPMSFRLRSCPPSPRMERKFLFKPLLGLMMSEMYLMQQNTANNLLERMPRMVCLSMKGRAVL